MTSTATYIQRALHNANPQPLSPRSKKTISIDYEKLKASNHENNSNPSLKGKYILWINESDDKITLTRKEYKNLSIIEKIQRILGFGNGSAGKISKFIQIAEASQKERVVSSAKALLEKINDSSKPGQVTPDDLKGFKCLLNEAPTLLDPIKEDILALSNTTESKSPKFVSSNSKQLLLGKLPTENQDVINIVFNLLNAVKNENASRDSLFIAESLAKEFAPLLFLENLTETEKPIVEEFIEDLLN